MKLILALISILLGIVFITISPFIGFIIVAIFFALCYLGPHDDPPAAV